MKNAYAIACVAAISAMASLGSARADVVASPERSNLCFDVNMQTNMVALWTCHGGANQSFFGGYGPQTFNGRCLDHGPLREGFPNGNGDLLMAPCNGSTAQKWTLSAANDPSPYRFRNEEGWCVNIPGGMGNANQGQQLIVYKCATNWGRGVNDIWASGGFGSAAAMGVPGNSLQTMNRVGAIYAANPATIVAAGGGNIVAAGGGNIVAAGGGNVVRINNGAALVGNDGASIVAAGGGNLISNAALLTPANIMNLIGKGGAGLGR